MSRPAGIVAVDWDDTLVDARTQEWLPGAKAALHQLLSEFRTVIIHTCRANWPEGLAQIEAKLAEAAPWRSAIAEERIRIEPKPRADFYIDNQAIRFERSWPSALLAMRARRARREAA